jgi:hypothetical protein
VDHTTATIISRTQACRTVHYPQTSCRRVRTVEQSGYTLHRKCLQTEPLAPAVRMTELLLLILLTRFSSPGLQSSSNLDAQRATEHEIDEVMGLGSHLGQPLGDNLRPQDLFSWSSTGHRNITSSGTRYFSINGGVTPIVDFNQRPNGISAIG